MFAGKTQELYRKICRLDVIKKEYLLIIIKKMIDMVKMLYQHMINNKKNVFV